MSARDKSSRSSSSSRPPATSPLARQNQLVSKAYKLIEERMDSGTASSQETTLFAKMGTEREALELEQLRRRNALLEAQVEQLASAVRLEELLGRALEAFKSYTGEPLAQPRFDDDDER